MATVPNLQTISVGVSTTSSIINNPIQCVTLITNPAFDKSVCLNGMNCNGICVRDSTRGGYCLTNVIYENHSQKDFMGHYNPCKGNGKSPLF